MCVIYNNYTDQICQLYFTLSTLCIPHCLIVCNGVSLVPVALCSILITKCYKTTGSDAVIIQSLCSDLVVLLHKTLSTVECADSYILSFVSLKILCVLLLVFHFS